MQNISSKYRALLVLVLVSLFITGCDVFTGKAIKQADQFIQDQAIDKTQESWKTSLTIPPQFEFTEGKKYLWILSTNKGDISIELMPDIAPMHVSSTLYLTKLGFYDGTVFHRVITGFMAQGGDPLGNGSGNPGYRYAGEFNKDVKHDEGGLLSMANAGPNTDGSQFFLTFEPTPWLDGRHTIFGKVTKGMEVLDILESFGSQSGKTSEELLIVTAKIVVE